MVKPLNRLILFILCIIISSNTIAFADDVLVMPESLQIIDDEAFYGDANIERVQLGDGVKEIRARAFANSSLSEINLPDSIEFIDDTAFDGLDDPVISASKDSYAYRWAVDRGLIDASFIPISEIEISEVVDALVGEEIDMRDFYWINPEEATNQDLEWSSEDTAIAIIDQNGILTAVGGGMTIVTGRTTDGSDIEINFYVYVDDEEDDPWNNKPSKITGARVYDGTCVTIHWEEKYNDTYHTVILAKDEAFDEICGYYELKNRSSIELDNLEEDTQYYVQVGTRFSESFSEPTTFTNVYSFKTGVIDFTNRVMQLFFDGNEGYVGVMGSGSVNSTDKTLGYSISYSPHNGSNKRLVWTSSDTEVATIDSSTGEVTCLSTGITLITAMLETDPDIWVAGWYIVGPVPPTNVGAVADGTTISMTWDAVEDADYYGVYCASGNNDIVVKEDITDLTESISGLAPNTTYFVGVYAGKNMGGDEGVAYGDMSQPIEIRTGEASGDAPVREIRMQSTQMGMYDNQMTINLSSYLTVLPEYATNKEVIWSSSNPRIARVDEHTGVVTAIAVGEAYITATALDGYGASGSIKIVVDKY